MRKRNNIGTCWGTKAIGLNRPHQNGIDKPETRSSTRILARSRIGIGTVIVLSVLALAFFGSAMRAPLMAASANVSSAWGKVLIAGGFGVSGPASSTELYDPATNSFADDDDTPVMNTGHYGATATLLASGQVLIAGGIGYWGPESSTELYDPTTNTFAGANHTAVMNAARYGATATLLSSGKVLIAGGGGYLSLAELYDPASNSFVPDGNMAAVRYEPTAALLASGMVLIAGGQGTDGWLSSTELYDPGTNSFGGIPPAMNTARYGATATLLASGKVLIAGGYNSTDGWLSSTELYDPATNSFAPAADTAAMTAARVYATATLLASGKVLIAGGQGAGGSFPSSTEIYDPATNSFSGAGDTAAMNSGRYGATATLLASGKVMIAGGQGAQGFLSSTELYDPATNSFADDTASMNYARTGAQAILLRPLSPSTGAVTLLPAAVEFGAVKIGQGSALRTVTLSNGTGKKLAIHGTAIGRGFKIVNTTCKSALDPNQSCAFFISFEPQGAGTRNEALRVTATGGNSPLKVSLHGAGLRR